MQKKKEKNRMQQFPFQEKAQLHVEFIKTPRNLGCVYINKNHEMGVGVTDKMMTTIQYLTTLKQDWELAKNAKIQGVFFNLKY